jgi:ParB/RepB/Spo0J family partition protein
MNIFNRHYIDLEHHCIELSLSHIRIAAPSELKKLITSIDSYGQIVPVIVVSAGLPNQFTLIDGYLRVQAMRKLKQDIIKAEVWECSAADALLTFLASHNQRHWEAVEEASALRELETQYQLSQEQIAKQIGRTQSWISRRLALLDALPDKLVHAITEGKIDVWTAQRVLVPMARAISSHAEQLFNYLKCHSHTTRELSDFFKHYQKSNKTAREKMVMQPDLFFKAQKALQGERQAKLLKAGPEGQWQWRLANIKDQIKYIEKLVPQLFYERQDPKISQHLREPLERIQHNLNEVLIQSRSLPYDRQDEASNHNYVTPIRQELSSH